MSDPTISNDVKKAAINEKKRIVKENIEIKEENIEIENKRERIRNRMLLRNRIKEILQQYGFTVTAVITSISVVIGVIVSNLSSGLSKMAKGVGKGLQDIGKKLPQILPGMIGAIASFIFKTAGEVVGFLGKKFLVVDRWGDRLFY